MGLVGANAEDGGGTAFDVTVGKLKKKPVYQKFWSYAPLSSHLDERKKP